MKDFNKRRSIRMYKDIPIEEEKLNMIIRNALIAPSSRGKRPWEFIVVSDKSTLENLSLAREHGSSFIKNAAVAIVVVVDYEKCDVWIEDASIAAYTVQLSAFNLGIESCWIQIREREHSHIESAEIYIKKILHVPENFKVECIIALGYSDEEKNAYTDADMDFSKIHNNKF